MVRAHPPIVSPLMYLPYADWFTGTDKAGKRGLFPANYVELIEGGAAEEEEEDEPAPPPAPPMPAAAGKKSGGGKSAIAQYE